MRSLMVVIAAGTTLLGVGCSDSEPVESGVTNAAPPPALVSAKPAPPEPVDTRLIVSGPIIVEHQLDITAQRDGILEKLF